MSDPAPEGEGEHPNATHVRQTIAALERGEVDAVLAAYADESSFLLGGNSPVSGTFHGHEEIRGVLTKLVELSGGRLSLDLHDVLADDHHAVYFGTLDVERDGKRLHTVSAMAFTIDDNGRFEESWFFCSDQPSFDAFYA
jgi:ketosteroid isomerase-like protein